MIKTNLEQFFDLTEYRKDKIKKLASNLNYIFLMSTLLLILITILVIINQLPTFITIIASIITVLLAIFYFIARTSIKDTFKSQLNEEKRDYALKNFKLYYTFRDYIILMNFILIMVMLFIISNLDLFSKVGI